MADTMREVDEAVRFFGCLYAACTGTVQFVALPDGGPRSLCHVTPPYDWPAAIAWAMERSAEGLNCYFAVATQPPGYVDDRTDVSAYELPGLFADVDLDGDAVSNHEAAWARLDATRLISGAVWSGGGWHLYSPFPEPVRLTDGNRDLAKDLVYAFGARANHLVHGEPRRPDRHDLASLLRVPGTVNHPNARKRAAGRVAVPTSVYVPLRGTVSPDSFAPWLDAYRRPRSVTASSTGREEKRGTAADRIAPTELPAEWDAWLADDPTLRGYFERTLPPQGEDQTPSGYALAFANRLANTHPEITDGEAVAALATFYERAGSKKHHRALAQTWAKARAAFGGKSSPMAKIEEVNASTSARDSAQANHTGFVRAWQLIQEPEEVTPWLVEGLLPMGGLSLLFAKPKVGKSTVARNIAVAVACGAPIFGRTTVAGPVLLVALEEKRADVKRHLAALGLPADAPLHVHVGPVPAGIDPQHWLREAIRTYGATFVVVDPIGRFMRVTDLNDYAQVTKATEPLIALAHETGAHIQCTHHAKKGNIGDNSDFALGSTAVAGFVDTLLHMKRRPDGVRTIQTLQRTGEDLPETVIVLDRETGIVSLGDGAEDARLAAVMARIADLVSTEALTEDVIRERLGSDRRVVAMALRRAVDDGILVRDGDGKRGDPYRYRHPAGKEASKGEKA